MSADFGSALVFYTAAHAGFALDAVPLGGGGAVADRLIVEWLRTEPFRLRPLTPQVLGRDAPSGRELVHFGERAYARFCRRFEQAVTKEIQRYPRDNTVVLANDISEGPDFAQLGARGYRIFTIFHVDVVAYIANIYLRGWVRPETTVRWYRRWAARAGEPPLRAIKKWVLPDMARLVWEKQEAAVRHSHGLIVPSAGMRDTILACYPDCPPGKIHVLPWGSWASNDPLPDPASLRQEFGVPANAPVLLTLSRISPEKGQDQLLKALLEWERRSDYPAEPLWLFICGDAAFMQGRRFLKKLRRLAARLKRTRVVFPGYVASERKRAFFALADLYVFPSRHESYGLTLLEALAAGLPAVCLDHDGARSVMREEFGALVPASQLREALARLLADEAGRKRMGQAAREFARQERFSDRAAELARIVTA